MTNKERAQKFTETFKAGGINVRRVIVLGGFVHVDTFEKYEGKLNHVMTSLGFAPKMVKNGKHLDGVDGFRMVFAA